MTGKTLSHYEIAEQLGEGGMGVVYKARDTRLNRFVAIKVLPHDKVADPERKRRFIQEAQAASALNHPNIITIHDIGQADGVDFIAMEYVAGKTLDRLVPKNGMRLAEVLKYAIQIANALARAHAAGIVHRDIKPGNIMVTPEGGVKVLDFGLAKLTERSEEDDSTKTIYAGPQSEEGSIVGTIAYMSPEQAEGKKVDTRSDIFSFGAVLYEMTTGRRAFRGETKMSTLAAILHKEPPPLREVAIDAPRDLEKIIARCLRKDPDRRFQHMSDVKVALDELKEESESGKLDSPAPSRSAAPTPRRYLVPALAVLLVTVGAVWWMNRAKAVAPASAPALLRLTSDSGLTTDPALSPDGKLLAYASDRDGDGNLDIWVQQVSGGAAIRLTRDPADDSEPVFSPDGSKIAFHSDRDGGGIYVMSALGGEARRIARQGRQPRFSPDGTQIAYSVGSVIYGKIYVVPSEGGQTRQIQPDFTTAREPIWCPDGKHLLFGGASGGKNDWWVTALDGGPAVQTGAFDVFQRHGLSLGLNVLAGSGFPELWLPGTDSVIFPAFSGDSLNLWEVSISPKTWQASGAPRRVMSGAGMEARPSIAAGRLVFTALSQNTNVWGLPIDANSGKVLGDIGRLTEGAARDTDPSISNDGKKLVFTRYVGRTSDVWLKDLESGQERRLASNAASNLGSQAGDGSKITYYRPADPNVLYAVSTSGGEAETLCHDCLGGAVTSLSRDGSKVLGRAEYDHATYLFDSASGKKTEILKDPRYPDIGRFSPDDRWIAFHTIPGAAIRQIFIAPFHGAALIPASEWIPITDGRAIERFTSWSPDGSLLYFSSDRDGFVCFWAQRLDPATKHPQGAAFPIRHFHTARRSLATIGNPSFMGMSVGTGRLIFSMTEQTGNIWMTELVPLK